MKMYKPDDVTLLPQVLISEGGALHIPYPPQILVRSIHDCVCTYEAG